MMCGGVVLCKLQLFNPDTLLIVGSTFLLDIKLPMGYSLIAPVGDILKQVYLAISYGKIVEIT